MSDIATSPVAAPVADPLPGLPRSSGWVVWLARLAALGVLAAAAVVIIGYESRTTELTGLSVPGFPVSAVAAVALACLAAMVLASSFDRSARIWSVVAATLAGAALASTVLYGDDLVSVAFAARVFNVPATLAGRMAPSAALCIILLAAAGWLSRADLPYGRRRVRALDVLSGVALVLSGLGALGYAYGARLLFDATPFRAMSLPTSLSLLVLSLATIASRPDGGWGATIGSRLRGGSATRRQLLFTLLPPVVGWWLVGAMDRGYVEASSAMALLVVLTIVPLALLVLRDGAVLDLLDIERRKAAGVQVMNTQILEARLAAQAAELDRESDERRKVEAALSRAQRLEAVGQLTGGIAHDFNNLLMAVRGNLDLIQRRLPADSPLRRHLEHALAATAKGTKVTQQLLAFSRTQQLEVHPIDVSTRLREVLGLIEQALGPETQVVLEPVATPLWAEADPDQLELAVLNLAINSRDAMPAGGTIRIGQAARTTTDRGRTTEWVVLRIADDGEGMTPEVLEHATEPFFTTKPQGRGTGLGLAQAYGFAKQCGGDLRITSEHGRGTTVEIWLQRARAQQPHAAPPTSASTVPRGMRRRRVVVIDDDDAVRAAVADALRQGGHLVTEASNGIEGLERLADVRPDVAVVDFLMPGLNGAEVARKAQVEQPELPVVFISGFSDTVTLDGISNSVVLRKPFEFDALIRSIDDVAAR